MNTSICTSDFLEDLRALAQQHLPNVELVLVPSVKAWCEATQAAVQSPFKCGAALRNRETGRFVVLLAEEITPDMHASRMAVLRMRPSLNDDRRKQLEVPQGFVRHLLLHEVAHALDSTRNEEQCDDWAFQQLERPHAA
jgi:hypothetical protein